MLDSLPIKPFPKSHRLKVLIAGAIVLILLIVATSGYLLLKMHQQSLKEAEANLLLQSLTLAEAIEHTIRPVDLVLERLAEKISLSASSDKGWQQLASRDFHVVLKESVSGLRQIEVVAVVDADGMRINDSRDWPNLHIDLSSRDYFQTLKTNAKITSFISEPMIGRVSKHWVIVLARPLSTNDGKFLGVIFASMTLQFYESFFGSTSLGDGYAATLMRNDGTLLARYPPAGTIGSIAPASVLKTLTNSRSGVSRAVSPVDHEARIAAAYKLLNYPLVVVATRNENNAFAAWRETASIILFTGTGRVALVILAAFAIAAWWRQQDRLRQSEDRGNFAIESAALGTWYKDLRTDELWWSDRLRNMLGVAPTAKVTPATFSDIVHPADLSITNDIRRRSMTGLHQFEIEYRIIRADDRSQLWLNSKGSVDLDENGKPWRIYGVVQDITERITAERERGELRRRLMQAQEDERLRLAHDLHDRTGQNLAAVMMELKGIEALVNEDGQNRVRSLRNQLEQMGKSLHNIAWELRPASIDELGLTSALANYLTEWSDQFGIEADFHFRDRNLDELPDEVRTTIYRVVQEGLTNIIKHAPGATMINVVIDRTGAMLRMTIDDNGGGFDVTSKIGITGIQRGDGLGLAGMRERLTLIGGQLDIESSIGSGTTIFVRIPVEREGVAA